MDRWYTKYTDSIGCHREFVVISLAKERHGIELSHILREGIIVN